MSNPASRLLILGIGNLLMGDEGVGIHVVQRLEKMKLPDCVACLDGGCGSFYLLESMQQAERILLIDAASSDDPPGTIRVLRPKFSRDYPRTLTAHDIGLKDLLDGFYVLGTPANVTLIAITIDPNQSLGMDLSPAIAKAADQAIAMALEEVQAAAANGIRQ